MNKNADNKYTNFDPLLYNLEVDSILNKRTLDFDIKLHKPSQKALNCFLMNLLCKPEKIIRMPFNDNYYNGLKDNKNNLKREAIVKIKDELERLGYLKVIHQGFYDRAKKSGKITRVAATDKFWNYLLKNHNITKKTAKKLFKKQYLTDPIIRKKAKDKFKSRNCHKIQQIKNMIVFPPDQIREILNNFNSLMQPVEIKDPEGHKLPITQFTQRISHETEFVTGRIYDGNLQNLKKVIRRNIIINDEPVVEVDFVSYSLAIIHAIENAVPEDNDGDLYKFKTCNVSRATIKKTINAMLNTYSESSVIFAINSDKECTRSLKHHGIKAKEAIQTILSERPFLKEYAFKGVGYYLTYLDAQITLHIINNMTAQQQIPVIPIHDSFIVQRTNEQKLIDAMVLGFMEILHIQKIIPKLKIVF